MFLKENFMNNKIYYPIEYYYGKSFFALPEHFSYIILTPFGYGNLISSNYTNNEQMKLRIIYSDYNPISLEHCFNYYRK